MSVHDLNTHKRYREASVAGGIGFAAAQSCSGANFQVFRDGVLHSVLQDLEPFVRNRVIALSNLHPEHSWDYAQA